MPSSAWALLIGLSLLAISSESSPLQQIDYEGWALMPREQTKDGDKALSRLQNHEDQEDDEQQALAWETGGLTNLLKFGKRNPWNNADIIRLGKRNRFDTKSQLEDVMRFGKRSLLEDSVRFGKRVPLKDAMRFGKRVAPLEDAMRFGKRMSLDDSMRFGKRMSLEDSMRFGKRMSLEDSMRFGKRMHLEDSLRFGKRDRMSYSMRLGKPHFPDFILLADEIESAAEGDK